MSITGYFTFFNHPIAIGAYNVSVDGHHEVFISKLNYSFRSFLASTVIIRDSGDDGRSVILDISGIVDLKCENYSLNSTTSLNPMRYLIIVIITPYFCKKENF